MNGRDIVLPNVMTGNNDEVNDEGYRSTSASFESNIGKTAAFIWCSLSVTALCWLILRLWITNSSRSRGVFHFQSFGRFHAYIARLSNFFWAASGTLLKCTMSPLVKSNISTRTAMISIQIVGERSISWPEKPCSWGINNMTDYTVLKEPFRIFQSIHCVHYSGTSETAK